MKSTCIFLLLVLINVQFALAQSVTLFAQGKPYCLDLDTLDFASNESLNQDIAGKKVILLGEYHCLKADHIFQAGLWIHLNKNYGVRHLLIEFGRSEAFLYNQYLKTGKTSYLDYTFYGFNKFDEFFKEMKVLYEYNLMLESDKKLEVHGLDLEREPGLSTSLDILLSGYSTDPSIEEMRSSLQARLDTIGVQRKNKEYVLSLREKMSALALPEGEDKKVIDYILGNNCFAEGKGILERDKYMAESFMELDTANEVYFGQFGILHTILASSEALGGILNGNERYRDKLLVVMMVLTKVNSFSLYNKLSDCPVFLYRLDSSDTQFMRHRKMGHWLLVLKDQPRYKPSY